MHISDFIGNCQERVDAALERNLKQLHAAESNLGDAIRYGVLNGGKRVRPVLLYATAATLQIPLVNCDNAACAVELIHAYSLIHDDLPAMDDDELRRGAPTCHIAYGEATAILAGDAMQALAFEILIRDFRPPIRAESQLSMIRELARASGAAGMAGGQAIDLASTGKTLSLEELEQMHRLKTGALIRASVMIAALMNDQIDKRLFVALESYAKAVGLAFQIKDDILDVTADTETLGKPMGSDQAQNKATYVSILGLERAESMAREQHDKAILALEPYGPEADILRGLSAYIVERNN